jgi:hypothetical protein
MKNSTLLYVIVSNLVQVIFHWCCYKFGFGLGILLVTIWSITLLSLYGKTILKYILPTAIPAYLICLIINKINDLINKLIIYLDSKEQIIK